MNLVSQHKITVVSSNGSCKFEPEALQVNGGDEVTFVNETSNAVAITFSNQMIMEMAYLPLQPGESHTISVVPGEQGDVTCTVTCNMNATIVFMTAKPTVIVNRN